MAINIGTAKAIGLVASQTPRDPEPLRGLLIPNRTEVGFDPDVSEILTRGDRTLGVAGRM